jgi:tRNA A-37 threonylcarbamoyl transferase component Bud32
MTEARACPRCGVELPVDAPEGLCPRCLLQQGIGEGSGPPANAGNDPTLAPRMTHSGGPMPGAHVRYFGDYEILEEIARGGMGVVYKARQVSLDRVVALKMILAGHLASEADVQRFYVEAKSAANLQHPNIVAIHEVGQHNGQHYFSMDYVPGKSLAELVREGPLPAERAASLVKTIAEAVHFAHQRGILHRDLKPQNVLIDGDDRPRVTDFGLAKRIETESGVTQTGEVLGSPSYMPPEQAASRPEEVGPHSDVYSLGALLYELLTSRPPFRGATAWETIAQVLQKPPASLRKVNPDVPQDLETICLKCLEKSPERRYHSARELAEELGRFLNHAPIHARPASVARRAAFWATQHPWAIAAAASLLMLGLAFIAYGLWAQNRFLIWLQSHPDYVREPGPWTERLEVARVIGIWLGVCTFFAVWFYGLSRAGWRQLGKPIPPWLAPRTPPSPPWALALTTLGGGSIVFSFIFLAITTEARVWEGRRPTDLGYIYFLFGYGLSTLMTVVRDFKRRANSTARPLPPEDENAVRQAMLAGNTILAIILYRSKVPGASLAEARDFVRRLALGIEARNPGELAAIFGPVGPPRRLKPQRLIAALLIVCAILGAILPILHAPAREIFAIAFPITFVCGFVLALALKSLPTRRRVFVSAAPCCALLFIEALTSFMTGEVWILGMFSGGFLAGIVLFTWAYARIPASQPVTVS